MIRDSTKSLSELTITIELAGENFVEIPEVSRTYTTYSGSRTITLTRKNLGRTCANAEDQLEDNEFALYMDCGRCRERVFFVCKIPDEEEEFWSGNVNVFVEIWNPEDETWDFLSSDDFPVALNCVVEASFTSEQPLDPNVSLAYSDEDLWYFFDKRVAFQIDGETTFAPSVSVVHAGSSETNAEQLVNFSSSHTMFEGLCAVEVPGIPANPELELDEIPTLYLVMEFNGPTGYLPVRDLVVYVVDASTLEPYIGETHLQITTAGLHGLRVGFVGRRGLDSVPALDVVAVDTEVLPGVMTAELSGVSVSRVERKDRITVSNMPFTVPTEFVETISGNPLNMNASWTSDDGFATVHIS